MRTIFISFFFIFCILTPIKAWSWDPLGLGGNIGKMKDAMNEIVEKVIAGEGQIIEQTRQGVNQVIDKLFDEKFVNLIAQIQAMIDKNLNRINEIIQQEIDLLFNRISDLVNQIATRAKELIDHTVEEIKTKIIDEFFAKADALCANITAEVIQILDKIDNLIYQTSCSEQALVDKITRNIVNALPSIPNPFDSCRKQINGKFPGHDLLWKFFSSYTTNELYEYKKCLYFIDINEKTPVQSILLAYRDLEALAGDMRCAAVALRLTENIFYYVDEMTKCVTKIDLWKRMHNLSLNIES